MKIQKPDYENCITNLACSVLKEFGIKGECPTLGMADSLLEGQYQNVVILLLDGMGSRIMEKNLEKDGFFFSHLKGSYSSVFPPTTVAATTTVRCGLNPVSHAWLGWDCYYKELDKNVTVFTNAESDTDRPAADFPVAQTYCPFEPIVTKIQKNGGNAYGAEPFSDPFPQDFDAICRRVEELCALEGRKYIYAYWNQPDAVMHKTGCYSKESREMLRSLEERVRLLCADLKDTLLFVTADHGLIDSRGAVITDYPAIMDCLVRMPSIEPRALNLFVKPGKEKQLEQEFKREFGDTFLLLTHKEVKEMHLFGTGTEHKRFDEMLGDYLAVAVSDLSIYNTEEERNRFIGVHAGMTEDEMSIPLIAIGCI